MEFRGVVRKKTIARGSKSERSAVVLRTPNGELVLRRDRGHAFRDEVLEQYVGKNVEISGDVYGTTLIIKTMREGQS